MGRNRLCIIVLLLAAVMAAVGCSDEEVAGPAGRDGIPDAFIVGYVSQMEMFLNSGPEAAAAAPSELVECSSRVSVSNVLSIPGVWVNGTELLSQSGPMATSYAPSIVDDPVEYPLLAIEPVGGGLSYYGTVWIDEEENAHLVVEFARPDGSTATAEATVCVPGYFSILEVTNGGNITPTSNVMAEWNSADDAERYYIYWSYSCSYRNLSEQTVYMYGRSDTVIADTTYIFQGEDIFPSPPDLDYFLSLDGYAYITPACGPIDTGDLGNVTGDGEGFFTGIGPSRSIHLLYMPRASAADAHE
ncbi:MAG TPA: hypothetical protein ENO08_04725 [Candidatus Eisenbacteria bacterium]|uniref:DUF4249 family protein n=1 Tax=Eiseniibacteriota bacterium TaxID=2212470 RepID=A0A7V2F3U3_UNCEI|nr:hypothetical protein [Candidatus Eisenbacteria bacterium]